MTQSPDSDDLIKKMKTGDKDAANELITQYFDRVLRAAEKRLSVRSAKGSSPDDIAVSVFESLWRRAKDQRFDESDLASPEELWRLLAKMVEFKTDDHARRQMAQKRGSGNVRGESVFVGRNDSMPGFDGQSDSMLSPDDKLELEEGYGVLMEKLDDEILQRVSVMRLENYKVSEIAEEFGKSDRWVKRKLALIREIWAEHLGIENE